MPDIYVVSGPISDLIFLYLFGIVLCGFAYGFIEGAAKAIYKRKKK